MKIALVRRQFSPTGGAELYLGRLMQELARRGHEVHLFAEGWEPLEGCEFHPIARCASRGQRSIHFAREVARLLDGSRFDCVFSLERTVRQDVYRAGDGVHYNWLRQQKRFAPFWRKPFAGVSPFHRRMLRLERETISPQNTRRIIVNSEMVRNEIVERFNYPVERMHLIRNGIEYAKFNAARAKREEARLRFGITGTEFLLLFVGSGWERKGLRFVLQAMKRMPKGARLLVVGKGKGHWPRAENVSYVGPVRDVTAAYAAADLFTSLSIYDPSANACFEAMAAGLPVITTEFDGANELIESGRNGSVISDPAQTDSVLKAVEFWRRKGPPEFTPSNEQIGIERNVTETTSVLELAGREKSR